MSAHDDAEGDPEPPAQSPAPPHAPAHAASERELAELAAAETQAAAVYSPDEIVSLVKELYELLVLMAQWPQGSILYAPHNNPPVNTALGDALGYDAAVLDLMTKLPYLDGYVNSYEKRIFDDTGFANYLSEEDLKRGRRPEYNDVDEPQIDPWILPIAWPVGANGMLIMLDTKLGIETLNHAVRSR